jgi:hypothetical protein
MPQPAMHILIARRALRRWRQRPRDAPFQVDAETANAFYHGSLGPDMGLFPRGNSAVSGLAHRYGASSAARAMLASARTPVEHAFTWGWVTHVLADAQIHPLVNQAGRELLGGRAACDRRQLLVSHIRVELGLEAIWPGSRPGVRRTRLRHAFDDGSIGFMANALEATYDVPHDRVRLLASHRNVTTFAHLCLRLAALLGQDMRPVVKAGGDSDFLRMPATRRAASRLVSGGSPAYAFLNPVVPPSWLVSRVSRILRGFNDGLDRQVATRLRDLPDYDLNTGEVVAEGVVHSGPAAGRVA